jgi:hypothetical protein
MRYIKARLCATRGRRSGFGVFSRGRSRLFETMQDRHDLGLSRQDLVFQKGDVAPDFGQVAPNFRNITLQPSQTLRMTGLGLQDQVHLPVKRAQKSQRVARHLRSILFRVRIGHAPASIPISSERLCPIIVDLQASRKWQSRDNVMCLIGFKIIGTCQGGAQRRRAIAVQKHFSSAG